MLLLRYFLGIVFLTTLSDSLIGQYEGEYFSSRVTELQNRLDNNYEEEPYSIDIASEIYSSEEVDIMPHYPGRCSEALDPQECNISALVSYIRDNMNYEDILLATEQEYKLNIGIMLNESGEIQAPIIISSRQRLDSNFKNELIAVLKDMYNWAPAIKDHQPVSTKFSLPLSFDSV